MARGKPRCAGIRDCCRTATRIKPINFLYTKTKYRRPIIMHPSTKNLWRDRKTVSRITRQFSTGSARISRGIAILRAANRVATTNYVGGGGDGGRVHLPRRENAARRCFNKRLVLNRKSFNPFRSRLTRVLYAFKRRGYFWRRREGRREGGTRRAIRYKYRSRRVWEWLAYAGFKGNTAGNKTFS